MIVKTLQSLQGRRAFITGSSEGIGKAIAVALAGFGAEVVVHAKDNEHDCRQASDYLKTLGVNSSYVIGDLAEEKAVERMYADVVSGGKVDILILNASVQIRKPFLEITKDEYQTQTQANFWSTIRLIQLLLPQMQQRQWGRILTVGSVQQQKPNKDMAVYAATKSAVVNLVKNVARQVAKDNVTINNLAPGVVKTKRNEEALADPNYAELVRSNIPLGFFAEAEDCAGMAALLCSDGARYITGQDIYCDGGMSL